MDQAAIDSSVSRRSALSPRGSGALQSTPPWPKIETNTPGYRTPALLDPKGKDASYLLYSYRTTAISESFKYR